jgi:hypothetical protein
MHDTAGDHDATLHDTVWAGAGAIRAATGSNGGGC